MSNHPPPPKGPNPYIFSIYIKFQVKIQANWIVWVLFYFIMQISLKFLDPDSRIQKFQIPGTTIQDQTFAGLFGRMVLGFRFFDEAGMKQKIDHMCD